MSNSGDLQVSSSSPPHVALIPSSGMGHLTPFLRLAASLVSLNCRVTFITIHPTVSLSESQLIQRFLSTFPQVTQKEFHLLPFDPTTASSNDPFFLQFESIRRSAPLLSPLFSSLSPPLSALVTDIVLASEVIPVSEDLSLPNYILFTSSAKMLSLCAYFPTIIDAKSSTKLGDDDIKIPGILPPIPISSLPQILLDLTSLFCSQFIANGRKLVKSNGILINTFDSLEPESLAALNDGKVVKGLPPVIAIGPFVPCDFEGGLGSPMAWLDDQPVGSVAYVNFGSRTAMSREQIRELGEGLERSGCRFLWVVKDKKVDREDVEGVEEVVGHGFIERVKDRGLVVKDWVNQKEILDHPAVGGFVSHCGWNSMMETALKGVRVLAWPLAGDQRINAEVVERSGLGMWVKSWGWVGGGGGGGGKEEVVVKGEDIGERVREMMGNEGLRMEAAHVREEGKKAIGVGGSSEAGLLGVIGRWKNTPAVQTACERVQAS